MAISSMRTARRWRGIRAEAERRDRQAVLGNAVVFRDRRHARRRPDAFIAVMRGEEIQTEMRLSLPIGERYFDFAMRPLRDQHGAIIGAVPEAVDITERRQGEKRCASRRRWKRSDN